MAHRPLAALLLIAAFFITVSANAQQAAKPFTQEQVQAMVRDGLGDETGAKAGGSARANAQKLINPIQIFALLASEVPSQRVATLVESLVLVFQTADNKVVECT